MRGWARRPLWTDMAVRGFRNQYKSAFVGAFWLTLITATHAGGWALIRGLLFGGSIKDHLPWLLTGIIVWGVITAFINGGCSIFTANARVFKDFPVPLSLFSYRLALNQIIQTAYKAPILVIVLALLTPDHLWAAPIALVGFALVVWVGFWLTIPLGVITARYGDFGQMVAAVMRFSFFLTPIIWTKERVSGHEFIVDFNPFYHLIQVVRGPLLGSPDYGVSFLVVIGLGIFAPLAAFAFYGRYSNQLPYWC